MAATTPARALGLAEEVGALEAGLRADLVVLSPELEVKRVMRAGAWV
jgi:N-acetylglucosamine-6-phosphate deacetylase